MMPRLDKAAAVAPISRDVRTACETLAAYGRRLVSEALIVGTAGNLSIRVGRMIVITPTGRPYQDLSADDMCVLDGAGRQIHGPHRPSSEYPMHSNIYETTTARAITHTHSPAAVAVSTTTEELPAIHYSILRLGGHTVRVSRYETFGTPELAAATTVALTDRSAALLQNHGAVAIGDSMREAFERVRLLEWLCEVYCRAQQIGSPRILSGEELDEVKTAMTLRRYHG